MKKRFLLLLVTFVCLLTLSGCNNDSSKFKDEYEGLNGQKNSNNVEYRTISISKDNPFVYTTGEDVIKMIENKETFYLYIGSNMCPWCRSVIEKFIDVANTNDINKVYYISIWEGDHNEVFRDKYVLNDGNLEEVSSGTDAYHKLLEYCDEFLDDYTLTDDDGNTISVGEKRLFAPTFIYFVGGKAAKLIEGISELQTKSNDELTSEILKDEEKQFNEFFN